VELITDFAVVVDAVWVLLLVTGRCDGNQFWGVLGHVASTDFRGELEKNPGQVIGHS
jgi:hypothetical protein